MLAKSSVRPLTRGGVPVFKRPISKPRAARPSDAFSAEVSPCTSGAVGKVANVNFTFEKGARRQDDAVGEVGNAPLTPTP